MSGSRHARSLVSPCKQTQQEKSRNPEKTGLRRMTLSERPQAAVIGIAASFSLFVSTETCQSLQRVKEYEGGGRERKKKNAKEKGGRRGANASA